MNAPSLSARMMAASVVLAILVAAGFAILINSVSTLDAARVREAHSKDVTVATVVLEKLVIDLENGLRGFVLRRNERVLRPFDRARAQLPRRLRALESLVSANPAQTRRARALSIAIQDYIQISVLIIGVARDNPAAARTVIVTEEGKRHTDAIRSRVTDLLSAENAVAATSAESAKTQSRRAIILAISALVACALLIVLFGLYLARSIAQPVRAAATAASRLAEGDLSVRLAEDGPGEVSALAIAFNRMAGELELSRQDLETQNAKLRESEQRKSELVSIVSHELRTPLASVLGFTSLLLSRDIEQGDQRRYLEIIDLQGRRLSALLNDFLDVEHLEEGQLKFARQLINMSTVVDEQAQLFAGQSTRHTLDVELPAKPLPVRGDPNRLAQVIGNLLSNAIKYSPEGGIVKVVGERDEKFVRVSVRDDGLGIPEELQKRVFGKFFRGEAGASGIPGSGLGLTIAQSVVEAHGGRMSFKSAAGKGSVFSLELPLAGE